MKSNISSHRISTTILQATETNLTPAARYKIYMWMLVQNLVQDVIWTSSNFFQWTWWIYMPILYVIRREINQQKNFCHSLCMYKQFGVNTTWIKMLICHSLYMYKQFGVNTARFTWKQCAVIPSLALLVPSLCGMSYRY